MKFKKTIAILSILILTLSAFSGCKKEETKKDLVKVRLNEVVRSIFYAPMYVAISQGFFEEEGLEIELSTGQGADSTITKTQY
ncbi:MAG: putative transporter, substrate-binding protein [Caloramator sp.]|jgi:NitT/TauT family transport system substrate-binding protein|nr:ABC transporter substrate-binding protein [Caloramator sp.]MBZ4662754.1 putative transporter, substrate-binding protein [Caloramator sp.]